MHCSSLFFSVCFTPPKTIKWWQTMQLFIIFFSNLGKIKTQQQATQLFIIMISHLFLNMNKMMSPTRHLPSHSQKQQNDSKQCNYFLWFHTCSRTWTRQQAQLVILFHTYKTMEEDDNDVCVVILFVVENQKNKFLKRKKRRKFNTLTSRF